MEITERLSKETARDYAYRTLRENIIKLKLAPGSMVSENDLALEMGLSRTPTREALIELSKSQIVDVLPQKGSYITKIDYSMVDEARFMRLVLERGIVEILCDTATEEELKTLRYSVSLQEFYLGHGMDDKFFKEDNAFHRRLFEMAHKMQSYKLMNSMMIHFDRVRMMRLQTSREVNELLTDHKVIVEAIAQQNVTEAVERMTLHLTRYKVDAEIIRKNHPDYFID